MEISIGYYYLPKVFYNENGESIIPSIKLRFKLNDCLNVYSHETLKYVFSNLNYQNGINIHSNIDARLDKIELYTPEAVALDANGVSANPTFSLLASIDGLNSKYEIGYALGGYLDQVMAYADKWDDDHDKVYSDPIEFDHSPINFTPWELQYILAKAYLDHLGEDGILDFDGAETLQTLHVFGAGISLPCFLQLADGDDGNCHVSIFLCMVVGVKRLPKGRLRVSKGFSQRTSP
jgi:hypothetical protein